MYGLLTNNIIYPIIFSRNTAPLQSFYTTVLLVLCIIFVPKTSNTKVVHKEIKIMKSARASSLNVSLVALTIATIVALVAWFFDKPLTSMEYIFPYAPGDNKIQYVTIPKIPMWYLIPVVMGITFGIKFHLELYRQNKDEFISETIYGVILGVILGVIFGVISGNISETIFGVILGVIFGTIVGAIFGTITGTVIILMHCIFFTGLGIGKSVVYSIGTGMLLLAMMLVINSILPFLIALVERAILLFKTPS